MGAQVGRCRGREAREEIMRKQGEVRGRADNGQARGERERGEKRGNGGETEWIVN